MKVLLLPNNVASEISIKVRALKSIGVDVRGLADGGHRFQASADVRMLNLKKGDFINNRFKKLQFYKLVYDWIKWADVLHWVWDFGVIPLGLDRKIVERFDKPGLIQWCGSDIRIPEKTFEVNKFYEEAFLNGYEYQFESYENHSPHKKVSPVWDFTLWKSSEWIFMLIKICFPNAIKLFNP